MIDDAGKILLAAVEALHADVRAMREEARADREDRKTLENLRKSASERKKKQRDEEKKSRDSHVTEVQQVAPSVEAKAIGPKLDVTGQSRDVSRDCHGTSQAVKAFAVVGDQEQTTRTKNLQRHVTVTGQADVTGQALQKAPGRTGPVWAAYSTAMRDRYGEPPTRNAKVNGQLSQLVTRLGEDAAPVAAFYVNHSAAWYATKGHQIGPLLADAEKLHLEWRTGRQINATTARIEERSEANLKGWMKHHSSNGGS